MMKKISLITLTILLSAALLAGCGAVPAGPAQTPAESVDDIVNALFDSAFLDSPDLFYDVEGTETPPIGEAVKLAPEKRELFPSTDWERATTEEVEARATSPVYHLTGAGHHFSFVPGSGIVAHTDGNQVTNYYKSPADLGSIAFLLYEKLA